MQGGIKSRGTKMSVLINLHGDSKSMTKAFFFFFLRKAAWLLDVSKLEDVRNPSDHTTHLSI